MKNKIKYLIIPILTLAISLTAAISAHAQEEGVEEIAAHEVEEENFFAKAYDELTAYAGEILCALTLCGSLTLAVAYKKGLRPLVEGSLVSIGNAVAKIKDNTKESYEESARLGESISGYHELINTLCERIEALDLAVKEGLARDSDISLERKRLSLVMGAQTDMLYDIFMTSALPQYQKDAVGEKIAKMKEAIAENAVEL